MLPDQGCVPQAATGLGASLGAVLALEEGWCWHAALGRLRLLPALTHPWHLFQFISLREDDLQNADSLSDQAPAKRWLQRSLQFHCLSAQLKPLLGNRQYIRKFYTGNSHQSQAGSCLSSPGRAGPAFQPGWLGMPGGGSGKGVPLWHLIEKCRYDKTSALWKGPNSDLNICKTFP